MARGVVSFYSPLLFTTNWLFITKKSDLMEHPGDLYLPVPRNEGEACSTLSCHDQARATLESVNQVRHAGKIHKLGRSHQLGHHGSGARPRRVRGQTPRRILGLSLPPQDDTAMHWLPPSQRTGKAKVVSDCPPDSTGYSWRDPFLSSSTQVSKEGHPGMGEGRERNRYKNNKRQKEHILLLPTAPPPWGFRFAHGPLGVPPLEDPPIMLWAALHLCRQHSRHQLF